MINRGVLTGRLTKNPEVRYTQSGAANATFTLAVNRPFTNQQGEHEADFINCVIWRKAAETFANFTHKGSLVGVEGRIQTRNYENQQGAHVYVTELVVENFSFLEPNPNSVNRTQQNNNRGAQSQRPTNNVYGGKQPDINDEAIDISDADLPF
ncbi:single-stranded DNA-binding protein [Furfurilactobacillus milii]|uniref:Single-stranded DNA-binding protein n=1 Tax=Furfurilactobacillus milii TaxID=2888272 RepID=A0ABT6DCL2_9LACO|nr:single-stranded DNA-binding protein [Furfurilactobacillus milii]QLE67442.1 Single-stranded DNA-binding protein [Furfurilactobacillus rossiae]MCF6161879.1 single-stranded DNA-binding protein [Furfurilactobacillus milii]MCF6164259.1 single-stranded DNA-binding protein [Furfurilactobacillus milii]MDF9914884.1 single-stranded DNA-binding protein [Furfurilactobacillus milii]QLE69871.1 Single-stranded DNA-binding protein [Furfurilactobacillus rossiae]